MRNYKSIILSLLLLACAGVLNAQATVGVPFSFDFGEAFSEALNQTPLPPDVQFSFSFTMSSGLPPGLTLSTSGLLSGTPTTAGAYVINTTFTFSLIVQGQETVILSLPIPFPFNVSALSGSAVAVDPGALSFSLMQGSTTVATQSISISNRGNQPQTFSASVAQSSGGSSISASGAGAIAPFGKGSVTVSVNPSGLVAGTYVGTVSISVTPGGQFTVPVIVAVSSGQQQLQLSSTGLRFQTVAGGGAPSAQSISVLNGGSGSLSFSASASTVSGGQGWLSVSPASGRSDASSAGSATVSINPKGLAAGDYYGQVQFSASSVSNSPQTASIVLNVAATGTNVPPSVNPTGLIFVGKAGGANPAAKSVAVSNPSSSPLTFNSATFFAQGNNWFTVQPPGGTVSAANSTQVMVQPNLSGLAVGVYSGEVILRFSGDPTAPVPVIVPPAHIAVLLIVVPAGSSAEPQSADVAAPLAAGCTPTKLLPVFTQLGAAFTTVASWPTPIEVTVVDDCGTILTAGSVVSSFSSGDPALSLLSLRDGRWSATWQPRSSTTQVTITVNALQAAPALQGTQMIGGALKANPTTPVIGAGGAVSAASFTKYQPLAPGGFTSIFGAHLSSGLNAAPVLPLAMQLGSTQVLLGGRQLPLQFAGDGQINAIIPYDVPPNSTQQLIVMNGPAISMPEPVVIAPAQPAVFTQASGAGVVFDGATLVDSDHPASANDIVVIYCAGLGPVDQPVPAGSASPGDPPAHTTNTVTVSIGGQDSPRVDFAGLVPGYAGLYQINAVVPTGITPGNAPLVITVAGQQSAPVGIAIK